MHVAACLPWLLHSNCFDNGWLLHHTTVTSLYLVLLSPEPFLFSMETLFITPSSASLLSHVSVRAIFFAGSDLHVLSLLEVDSALLKTKTKEEYWASSLLELTVIYILIKIMMLKLNLNILGWGVRRCIFERFHFPPHKLIHYHIPNGWKQTIKNDLNTQIPI